MFPRLLLFSSVFFTVTCCSCNNSTKLYPVTGKVFVDGVPAVGAMVSFVRKDSTDPLNEVTPQGIVGQDGSFKLSGPGGEGAPIGDFIVLVEWKEGAGRTPGRAPALSAPDRLKMKYLDPKKPLLTAKIEAKSNVLAPFELKE